MKRTIDNQPGFCYVVNDEPAPGIYESMRVVKRGKKFKVKSTYNNTITGELEALKIYWCCWNPYL